MVSISGITACPAGFPSEFGVAFFTCHMAFLSTNLQCQISERRSQSS